MENKLDECIYLKVSGSNLIFLVLYVDDILLASSDLNLLQVTKKMLFNSFEMKDLGEAKYVLGIEITRDRSKHFLGLSQRAYIEKVLKRFNMENCSCGEVPMVKGEKFSTNQCPRNELEKKSMEHYASVMGSLMYAQTCTRPDLSFAVSVLGRYQSNPGQVHWTAAKKVLRYLQRTKNFMLGYGKSDNLEVFGYTDSDLGGCRDDGKSTSGYVFFLAGGAISWKSKKQNDISTSTMLAEFVACFEATKKVIWLKNFIGETQVVDSITRPIKIFCDNQAAVFFSKNNKRTTTSLLMDIKVLKVRDLIKEKKIEIEYINSGLNIADPLTKALPVGVFKDHVTRMRVLESSDQWE